MHLTSDFTQAWMYARRAKDKLKEQKWYLCKSERVMKDAAMLSGILHSQKAISTNIKKYNS